ncbi:MAG: transcriptional regulator [bacterium]
MPDERTRQVLESFDRLLEHRVRLAIIVLLTRSDQLSFSRLKELTGQTDGNLGANLRKLEEAGYLEARKTHEDRRPVTWYSVTSRGLEALSQHIQALRELLGGAG